MNTLQIVFALWIAAVAGFTAVMVYRATLTQHETDQLFLSENTNPNLEEEHNEVVRRVNFIQPFCKAFAGATAATTALLLGVYIASALHGARI
jgi:hypothetical protein